MYNDAVTQLQIERVEAKLKIKLTRHDPPKIAEVREHLEKIYRNGTQARDWKKDEQEFIRNEQILSMLDFHYWVERYGHIIRDFGEGLGVVSLWASQKAVNDLIAKLEFNSWEAHKRGDPVNGILIALNKARQLGATMLVRLILMHRIMFYKSTRGFSASLDDEKVLELYERDKRIYDNSPFYIKPSLNPKEGSFDTKANHIKFGKLDSSILYQHGSQKTGLGQGRQFDVSHITECASFPNPKMIEHDFLPTIPQSPWAFSLLESTPQGRGNWWHTFSENVRLGRVSRWAYLFVPVYIEPKKYRLQPPDNWEPEKTTLEYAKKIEDTSPRVVGFKFHPHRQHLYWYEQTRKNFAEMNSLNLFLTNYAATPEESFQFASGAAFDAVLLEKFAHFITEPVYYEFERL